MSAQGLSARPVRAELSEEVNQGLLYQGSGTSTRC